MATGPLDGGRPVALAGTAAAEPVARFRFSEESAPLAAVPSARQDAAKLFPVRRLPKGAPGVYDPATGQFTQSPSGPAAAGDAVKGKVVVPIAIEALKGGVGPDDTVYCEALLTFGNRASDGHVFPNHYVRRYLNFAAGEPGVGEVVPFGYAPKGNGQPVLKVSVNRKIPFGSDHRSHAASMERAAEPLKDAGDYFPPTFVLQM